MNTRIFLSFLILLVVHGLFSQNVIDHLFIPGTEQSFKMVLLPGGQFTMGSQPTDPNRQPNEGTHLVQVDSFGSEHMRLRSMNFFAFNLYNMTLTQQSLKALGRMLFRGLPHPILILHMEGVRLADILLLL